MRQLVRIPNSPGTPGEGWGGGHYARDTHLANGPKHYFPLGQYRGRGSAHRPVVDGVRYSAAPGLHSGERIFDPTETSPLPPASLTACNGAR